MSAQKQLIGFLQLRIFIGILGFTFPIILIVVGNIWGNCSAIQDSLSAYYHTRARDVFVGLMFAIGTLFLMYRGYDIWDTLVSIITGLSAMSIALFPTASGSVNCTPFVGYSASSIHNYVAGTFFLCLVLFSVWLFRKKDANPTPEKLKRNRLYLICGIIMAVFSIMILVNWETKNYIAKLVGLPHIFTFVCEWITLSAFGLSWITKGEMILKDARNSI